MSQENMDTIRAFWGQWTAAGWTLEVWTRGEVDLSLIDPNVVYEGHNLPDHMGEAYRGHSGVIRAAERWTEPFECWQSTWSASSTSGRPAGLINYRSVVTDNAI